MLTTHYGVEMDWNEYLTAYILWFFSCLAMTASLHDAGFALLILAHIEYKFAQANERLQFHHETILGR